MTNIPTRITTGPHWVAAVAGMVIAMSGGASAAAAFDCASQTATTSTKATVCKAPQLRGLMKSELSRNRSLNGRLRRADDRNVVIQQRALFEQARDTCQSNATCLRDAYRAQIRLYDQLDICAARGGRAKSCLQKAIARTKSERR